MPQEPQCRHSMFPQAQVCSTTHLPSTKQAAASPSRPRTRSMRQLQTLTLTLGTFSTGNFTLTTASGSDIAVNGGTMNTGTSTMTIAGGLTVAGGTYNGNDATPTFSGAVLLSSGAYNGSTNGDTFSGGLTISGGTFTASDATTTVSGAWTFPHGRRNVYTQQRYGCVYRCRSNHRRCNYRNVLDPHNQQNNTATLTIASGDSLVSTGTLTLTNGAVGTGTLTPQGAVSVGAGLSAVTRQCHLVGAAHKHSR